MASAYVRVKRKKKWGETRVWHEFPLRFETRRGGQNVRAAQPFNNIFKTSRHIYIYTTRCRSLTCLTRVHYTRARMHVCMQPRACVPMLALGEIHPRTRRPLSPNALHNLWNYRGIVVWRRLYTTRLAARAWRLVHFIVNYSTSLHTDRRRSCRSARY